MSGAQVEEETCVHLSDDDGLEAEADITSYSESDVEIASGKDAEASSKSHVSSERDPASNSKAIANFKSETKIESDNGIGTETQEERIESQPHAHNDVEDTDSDFARILQEIDTEGKDVRSGTEEDPKVNEFLNKMLAKLHMQSADDLSKKSSSLEFFESVKSPGYIDEASDEDPSFVVLPGEEIVDCVPDKYEDSEKSSP